MNITKQKQTYRHREQLVATSVEKEAGRGKIGVGD